MTAEFNFHGSTEFFQKAVDSIIDRALRKKTISQIDANRIHEYLDELSGQNRIGPNRKKKLAVMHVKNREFLDKDYDDCNYSDLLTAIEKLKTAKKEDGSPLYAKSIVAERIWGFKNFFLWEIDNEYNTQIDRMKVMKIKLPKIPVTTVTEDRVPTVDEVCRIITSTTHPRDACIFTFTYDGAMRIGDCCGLRFRDLTITDDCIIARTSYKTGRNRTIPLYQSMDAYKRWMAVYPGTSSPDDFVFCHLKDKTRPLTYKAVKKFFDGALIRAELTGHGFTLHKFRHARISELLRSGMSESTLKLLAWGGESKAIQVYNHLNEHDVQNELARIQGIATHEKLVPDGALRCAVCGTIVSPLDRICPVCFANLDAQSPPSRVLKNANWGDVLRDYESEKMHF